MSYERVLITGAGGFLGSHVVEAFLSRPGCEVIALDSFRHNGAIEKLTSALDTVRFRPSQVTTAVHDLRAPFSATQRARLGEIHTIVNTASRCHVGESIADPVDFTRNNVDLMLNVLELARQRGARLIQMSTDEVYGPLTPASDTDHRPSNPYSASKAAQEDICHAYRRTYGVPVTIVSSANMFGERQSQLAYVPRIVRAVTRGERLKIHYHRGNPGTRHYTYVRNVAEELVRLARATDAPKRVLLPGQKRLTNLEIALRIADVFGKTLDHEVVDGDIVRPGYDPEYAWHPESDWKPHISFEDGLSRTVAWFVDNPWSLEN